MQLVLNRSTMLVSQTELLGALEYYIDAPSHRSTVSKSGVIRLRIVLPGEPGGLISGFTTGTTGEIMWLLGNIGIVTTPPWPSKSFCF